MSEANDRSRVLTLVFTDLADSTALKTERGDQAVDALITRHRTHVTRLTKESSGRVIDWAEDGCFLTLRGPIWLSRIKSNHSFQTDSQRP